MALTNYYSFKSMISSQQRETLNVLIKLGSNKDFIISEPNKDNGLVLLNMRDYVRKIEICCKISLSSPKLMEV